MYPKRTTPIKRTPLVKKLPTNEQKSCSDCGKLKILANKTRRLCATCLAKQNKVKQKLRKEKKRETRRLSISVLTKKLDSHFSQYIRLVECDHKGNNICFTCPNPEPVHWRKLQCGHFQSRRYLSTRWEKLNCKPQCFVCNIALSGQQYVFGKNLDIIHGKGTADEMVRKSKEFNKFNSEELLTLIKYYKNLVGEIKIKKSLV